MKKIIIGIVLGALLLFGCEKTSNPVDASENPAEEPGYSDKVLLSGQVVEKRFQQGLNYQHSPQLLPVGNATVTMAAEDSITDPQGQFQFVFPRGDSTRIQITHPLYLPFEKTAFFEIDTSVVYELQPIRADFLPLAVGNYWNYDYESFYWASGGSEVETQTGTQSWQVTDVTQDGAYMNYRILAILNATQYNRHTDGSGNYEYDSSLVQNDSSYFVISEDEENWLDVKYQQTGHRWLVIYPFQRYQPIAIGDTLNMWFMGESKYVREKGLVYFDQNTMGNTKLSLELKLRDFRIVPEE